MSHPGTGIKVCSSGDVESTKLEEATLNEVTMIGVDLAKSVFQAHDATAADGPVFRKKLSWGQFLKFLSEQPLCVVAMEAGASSHYWGREIMKLGHDVCLIPPNYVKPFVKRQKNDANDADVRRTMRP